MTKLVTSFEWRFLKPGFWGTWVGLAFCPDGCTTRWPEAWGCWPCA